MGSDDLSADYLGELSLEELLNIDVSVASVEEERIIETPAIVSRYDYEDLSRMGLRTLDDILSFVPGLVVMDGRLGNGGILVRGVIEAFGQKILFLLDGVPYWSPSHSAIPLLGIPIEAIDHVEIIRGPGAVIYGSNATAGVIKVVTRQGARSTISASAGSNMLFQGSGHVQREFTDHVAASLSFELQRDDGYDALFSRTRDGMTTTRLHQRPKNVTSVLGRFRYRGLQLLGHAFQSTEHGLTTNEQTNRLHYKAALVHARYKLDAKFFKLDIYSDYNIFSQVLEFEPDDDMAIHRRNQFDNRGLDNYRWRLGVSGSVNARRDLSFAGGTEYESRATGDFQSTNADTGEVLALLMPAGQTSEFSFYGQADYKLRSWRFLAGARVTVNEKAGAGITPRGSVVYNIGDRQSAKFLYSVGFNSPNFVQTSIDIMGGVTGNPDLTAERVNTFDLAYSYVGEHDLFVANLYYLQAEDFITRVSQTDFVNFVNGQNFTRYGAEFDYQRAAGSWRFMTNLAYHHQGTEVIDSDPTAAGMPVATVNFGSSYRIGRHLLGGSLRFLGDRAEIAPLFLFNLNYSLNVRGFDIYVTARNIFDVNIRHPDVGTLAPDLVPGGDGINFRAGARYTF